jgi:glycosyltransferase involved in cell wall biosynthesis
MKILQVIDSLNVGGAETLVLNLCTAWRNSGLDVELYALRGGPLEVDARRAGIPLHIAGCGSVYSPLHVLRLARFMRSKHFDIIHVHLFPAQLWACLAVRLARGKAPIVTTEHSTGNRRRTALFRSLDRWMYRQFAVTVAISEATLRSLASHAGDGLRRIVVIQNGIDETRFQRCVPRSVETRTAPTLLIVGSLTPVKDQATAIRAMTQVDGAELIIAGDGPLRSGLQALTHHLGVQDRVHFLGVRRDIAQLIAASDIYVQTSRWEGFCLAVVEAMCGGLPCVVSRVPGLEEVVGHAGLYFEPGNAGELALAIRSLLQDPEYRAVLADHGVERAKRFTLPACRARYEALYRTVTGARGRFVPAEQHAPRCGATARHAREAHLSELHDRSRSQNGHAAVYSSVTAGHSRD